MRRVYVGMMAVALACFATPASANLITNGSFEACVANDCPGGPYAGINNGISLSNLVTPGWDIYKQIPGWTTDPLVLTDRSGIEVQTAGTVGLAPKDGNRYVELDSNLNSAMVQTLALGPGQYQLGFWFSPRLAQANDNGILAFFNGGLLGEADSSGAMGWTYYSFLVTAPTAGNYTVKFAATDQSNSYGGFLDDVQLVAVPEPGLLGLVGVGLLAGGRRLRRR